MTGTYAESVSERLSDELAFRPRGSFVDAVGVLSAIAQQPEYARPNHLIVVIDGANKLFPESGSSPYVEQLTSQLSPYSVVVLLCSGSTVLDKIPALSHNRVFVHLVSAVDDVDAMNEFFQRSLNSVPIDALPVNIRPSKDQIRHVASILGGSFRDYHALIEIMVTRECDAMTALDKLKRAAEANLQKHLGWPPNRDCIAVLQALAHATDRNSPLYSFCSHPSAPRQPPAPAPAPGTGKQTLVSIPIDGHPPTAVSALVRMDVLVPYPDSGLAAESPITLCAIVSLTTSDVVMEIMKMPP